MKIFMPRRASLKLYSCDHCSKTYATLFSLRRHMCQYHQFVSDERQPTFRIQSRQEINSRYYEKSKDRRCHQRLVRKFTSVAHIMLLEEKIINIVDGYYENNNNNWPRKPIELADEDLDNPLINSKLLSKQHHAQMTDYENKLNLFKNDLKTISWDEIYSRAIQIINEMNISECENDALTDASDVDSDIITNDNESSD